AFGDGQGAFQQVGVEGFEVVTAQLHTHRRTVETQIVAGGLPYAQGLLDLLGGNRHILQELFVPTRVEVGILGGEAFQQVIGEFVVPVRATQPVITVGAHHPYVVVLDPDHRRVEGAPAQVVDQQVPYPRLGVQALVVQGGRHRFGHHVQDVQVGDLSGPPGGLPLDDPEVGRDGDDHVPHGPAIVLPGGLRQPAQDQRRNGLGRVL